MADVWTGINTRGNSLLREHVKQCRKRMREWTKRENQLSFELKGGVQCGKSDQLGAVARLAQKKKRNGSNS